MVRKMHRLNAMKEYVIETAAAGGRADWSNRLCAPDSGQLAGGRGATAGQAATNAAVTAAATAAVRL